MWKLYTSMRDSICIRSAYKQLWDCLPSKECYLGEVRYVDYETDAFDHSNLFSLVMHKRTSYAHEHEVRAVIINVSAEILESRNHPPGVPVKIDMRSLVNEVYIAPDAPDPLMEVVQRLVDQTGLTVQVKKSGVNAPPAY